MQLDNFVLKNILISDIGGLLGLLDTRLLKLKTKFQ